MKAIFTFLLLIIGIMVYAEENEENFISCDKVYVSYESLAFLPEGIFVNLGDSWMQTSTIHTDSQGFYFSDGKASFFWECPKCNYSNNFWSKTCGKCGYRP